MKKIIPILVVGILVLSGFGVASLNSDIEKFDSETIDYKKRYFTHTVLGEFGTFTGVEPSKYAHRALKNIYAGGWHPFYYITFVYDKNTHAYQRIKDELGLIASPTVSWDGGSRKDAGAWNTKERMTKYNTSIIKCGERNVADIDLSLDVEWLGAVNNNPSDGATDVSIDGILNWTNAAIDIEVTIDNNEASRYDGHLHVYVTEINSTMWNDEFGDPYTFEFKSYAFNEDITISAGGTWDDSTVWDGEHQTDGHGTNFTDVIQSNIMVIASVFDDNSNYTDETAGFVAGVGTDPKTYDVYFGDSNPPPKVASNISMRTFNVGELSFDTTYYWKIDVWDNQGNPTYGDIWSFTTRGNEPPNIPSNPIPPDGATNVSEGICWTGGDPDGDPVTYDVYLGNSSPPPKISSNQSSNCTDPGLLKFNTTYYWKIVAWDIYGASAEGPIWSFTTQVNLPPYEPDDPHPPDDGIYVPVNITLCWEGDDPNPGDIVTYDVYLGVNCPNLVSTNQSENCYKPTELELNKTYFWKIVAWDSQKLRAEGDVWSFTTGINHPPSAPIITNENIRIRSRSVPRPAPIPGPHNYTFKATDPDGHDVYYWIEWDDGNIEEWIGPYPSGEEITLIHTYSWGNYAISARAKDIYGAIGDWGYMDVIISTENNNEEIQENDDTIGFDFIGCCTWYHFVIGEKSGDWPLFWLRIRISCTDLDTGEIRYGRTIFGIHIFKFLKNGHDYK